MHQAVMHNKIEQAVERHTRADPLQGPDTRAAQINEQNRQSGEHYGIEVINLKPAFMRFMM
ncbi:hypothetical protein DH20_21080 [Pantoea agglomerans]|nr:hypothetical protein [Pantoea agglomerans]